VTVREPGKPDQKCKVLKVRRDTGGKVIYELESLTTGERMTIVDAAPPAAAPASATPPASAGRLAPATPVSATPSPSDRQPAPAQARRTEPPLAPARPAASPSNYAVLPSAASDGWHKAAGPSPASPAGPASGYATMPAVPAPLDGWRADHKVSPPVTATTAVENVAAAGPSAPTSAVVAAGANSAPATAPVDHPALVEPTPASDWRESWGKANDHKVAVIPAESLPQADTTRPDPLQDPEHYMKPVGNSGPAVPPVTAAVSAPATAVAAPATMYVPGPATPPAASAVPIPTAAAAITTDGAAPASPHPAAKHSTGGLIAMIRTAFRGDHETAETAPASHPALPSVQPGATIMDGEGHFVPAPMIPGPVSVDADSPNAFSPGTPGRNRRAQDPNAFGAAPDGPADPSTAPMDRPGLFGRLRWRQQPSDAADQGMGPLGAAPAGPGMMSTACAPGGMPPGAVANGPPPIVMPGAPCATAPMSDVQQLTAMLRDGPYPSQREWAAESLAAASPSDPAVVQALLRGAQEDLAPTVRATCVHCLAGMNAHSAPVLATLYGMQADPDARVRQEVQGAIGVLGSAANIPANAPAGQLIPVRGN
jgi:hypothetical protein